MKKINKIFTIILIIIAVLAVLGTVLFLLLPEREIWHRKENNVVEREEIKEVEEKIDNNKSDLQTYRNEDFGFEFKYPNTWTYTLNDIGECEKSVTLKDEKENFNFLICTPAPILGLGVDDVGIEYIFNERKILETNLEDTSMLYEISKANNLKTFKKRVDIVVMWHKGDKGQGWLKNTWLADKDKDGSGLIKIILEDIDEKNETILLNSINKVLKSFNLKN